MKELVLLTNDDGIYAKGIRALYKAFSDYFDIVVVAPESEQSAIGHAITLSDPLRVKEINREDGFKGYAVNGTPSDCVKIAINELLDPPPSLVVSGINLGPNVGINVLYSGTVSAATESAILGYPAIAVSLNTYNDPDFSFAASYTVRLARSVLENGLPTGVALNVNIPAIPSNKILGVKITRQGSFRYIERFDRRVDPKKRVYYWQVGDKMVLDEREDTDHFNLIRNYITITPISYDLTDYNSMDILKNQWNVPEP